MMRVSIFFYQNIDPESVLWRSLVKLNESNIYPFYTGVGMGLGAEKLTWKEATLFISKIAVTVHKSESESVFNEMRLIMQEDQENSTLPF